VAGLILYLSTTILGKTIGFTLTLAGIAGAIVSIGITADSFIVYFERIRDEIREGRTLRSAVETGWQRARRTILVADFVSIIAAVLLYFFAVGGVRGFAFTLGLTTLIDLAVVFWFTKPLMTVLARTKFFNSGSKLSGLSPESLGGIRKGA
jgi:preprotein translocase subunit SecD